MQIPASRPLKFAYAMTVLAAVVPIGLASSGWVALATGGGHLGLPFIGPILFLVLGIYRLITVFTNPDSLSSYEVGGFAVVLRKVGVLALYVGAIIGLLNFVSVPLMMATISRRSDSGIAFFVVGTYLAILGSIGTLGIISFELSRILGLEDHVRRATS